MNFSHTFVCKKRFAEMASASENWQKARQQATSSLQRIISWLRSNTSEVTSPNLDAFDSIPTDTRQTEQ